MIDLATRFDRRRVTAQYCRLRPSWGFVRVPSLNTSRQMHLYLRRKPNLGAQVTRVYPSSYFEGTSLGPTLFHPSRVTLVTRVRIEQPWVALVTSSLSYRRYPRRTLGNGVRVKSYFHKNCHTFALHAVFWWTTHAFPVGIFTKGLEPV